MVKRDPDSLITATSKYLKAPKTPTLRFTFKRGGLWQPQFAKAHSRRDKVAIRTQLKFNAANQGQEQEWPLLVRFKTNQKEDSTKLNAEVKPGKGGNFIESLLGVFRVNFFKKKGEEDKNEVKTATKANPNSKSSLKKKAQTERNRERRKKRVELNRQQRKAKQVAKK